MLFDVLFIQRKDTYYNFGMKTYRSGTQLVYIHKKIH